MADCKWMYRAKRMQNWLLIWVVVGGFVRSAGESTGTGGGLSSDYYSKTCPQAEAIIKGVMVVKQREAFVTAAGTLRIFFHDCFVSGCDASVIIASTPGNLAEKDSQENLSLPGDGFDAIMRAKEAVERVCPGVVSCADIISITTRDLVGLVGGPFWQVLKGRKDSRSSKASSVEGNLPKSHMGVDQLTKIFQQKGFSREEMVVLSGGHTIGFSHCSEFTDRIYGFKQDSAINSTFAGQLRQACPIANRNPTVVAFNDVSTPRKFDNVYFSNLQQGRGLLPSDQVLWTDPRTKAKVSHFASSKGDFFKAWVSAMQKLSLVGVKTGGAGEVRRRCDAIN